MKDIEDLYPLSPMQQGMLFHTVAAGPGSGMYVTQHSVTLAGGIDLRRFTAAWQQIVVRHPVLRTEFLWEDVREPVQIVRREVPVVVREQDWTRVDPARREARLAAYLEADRREGFDLDRAPLMRLSLIRLTEDVQCFSWTFHHLILDGWSVPRVLREVMAVYEASRAGRSVELPPARPFGDYIRWLYRQDLAAAEVFWRAELRGFGAPTALPGDSARDASGGPPDPVTHRRDVPAAAATALRALARREQVTLNTLIQTAWVELLAHHSGDDDVVCGAVVLGRPAELDGVEKIAGMFVNTIPLRHVRDPDATVGVALRSLQTRHLEGRAWEFSPLLRIRSWSEVPPHLPLFRSLVVFETFSMQATAGGRGPSSDGGARGARLSYLGGMDQVDLPLSLRSCDPSRTLPLWLTHDRHRFRTATAHRLLRQLVHWLEDLARGEARRLDELSFLSPAERHQSIVEWNDTCRPTSAPAPPVHTVISRRARRAPRTVAVVDGDVTLSFAELDARSNQLAHFLLRAGAGPGCRVGLCLRHSPATLVSILGVLKAGAAYVALDPKHPPRRLAFQADDAQLAFCLRSTEFAADPPWGAGLPQLDPEADWQEVAGESTEAPEVEVPAEALAYVIYTSGSTGPPKGVAISHAALGHYVEWASRTYLRGATGRSVPLYSSLAFDLTVTSIHPPLCTGNTVRVIRQSAARPAILEALDSGRVDLIKVTPSHLALVADRDNSASGVRRIVVGGEALDGKLAARILDSFGGGAELLNEYGPTETTVGCTSHRFAVATDRDGDVPIGRPAAATTIRILDQNLRPVAIGVAGELTIAGDGLARGYLARPARTAERFLPDPFAERPGERLYRSGDLARWRSDGRLEFLGRYDEQVKFKGHRVELGEVARALMEHPAIRRSVARLLRDEQGQQAMVAYYEAAGALAAGELRTFLEERLIGDVVPNFFVHLAEIPLTVQGKVDLEALPALAEARAGSASAEPVHPRTPTEEALVEIWREVLKVPDLGVRDDFFELGGHSLLAVRLMATIRHRLHREVPVALLLEGGSTIERLAAELDGGSSGLDWSPVVALRATGDGPPFFCVHAVGGEVLHFRKLAEHLDDGRPFYGIQAPPIHAVSPLESPRFTLEERAALYLEAVREVCPRGPYLLGGYSFGGFVAFEMAQQLVRDGEDVALLAILDTPALVAYPHLLHDPDYVINILIVAHEYARVAGGHLALRAEELRGLELDDQLRLVLERLQACGAGEELNLDLLRRTLRGHQARFRSLVRYRPRVYPGRITVFHAQDGDPGMLRDGYEELQALHDAAEHGWDRLTETPVAVHWVPGHHEEICREPHVRILADRLRSAIAASLAPSKRSAPP